MEWIPRKLEWNYIRWEIIGSKWKDNSPRRSRGELSFHEDPISRILCNTKRVCGGFFHNTLSNILFRLNKEELRKSLKYFEFIFVFGKEKKGKSLKYFGKYLVEIFRAAKAWNSSLSKISGITKNQWYYPISVVLHKMSGITQISLQWNYNVTKSIISDIARL